MSKLTIQYIWVEKYKCFENMEFNFSSKHHFHYNQEINTLIHEDHSSEYVEGFFGENVDLTAIVGNNGAGKTSVIKMICENLANGCGGIQINCIVVMKAENILVCYYYLNLCTEGEMKTLNIISPIPANIYRINLAEQKNTDGSTIYEANADTSKILTYRPELFKHGYLYKDNAHFLSCSEMRFIRLTQTLDRSDYREQLYGVTDLSTSCMIRESRDEIMKDFLSDCEKNLPKDHVIDYFHKSFSNQIDFVCNYIKNNTTANIIPFKLPDYVEVFISADISEALIELKKENSHNEISEADKTDIRGLVSEFWNQRIGMTKNLHTELSKGVIANFIYAIANLQTNNPKLFQILTSFMRSSLNKDNIIDKCIALLGHLLKEIEIRKQIEPYDPAFCVRYIKSHILFLEFIKSNEFKVTNERFVNGFIVSLKEMDFSDKRSNFNALCGIEKFYQEYKKVAGAQDFLSFSWNLSSGEMAMLNLYSRFFSIVKSKTKNRGADYYLPIDANSERLAENALIFIDEADMLFHPEWQQKYINSLLSFLKDVYPDTHLQIIIATHSPIMLSDIPKQNVIYLHSENVGDEKWKYSVDDSSDHAETFGANIFRLFNDAFFLQEGAIGAFAEEKIKELLKLIDNSANGKKDEIQKQIRLIGDPFLKAKVEAYFLSKIKDQDLRERQRLIENEIAFLNQKLADLKAKRLGGGNPDGQN